MSLVSGERLRMVVRAAQLRSARRAYVQNELETDFLVRSNEQICCSHRAVAVTFRSSGILRHYDLPQLLQLCTSRLAS